MKHKLSLQIRMSKEVSVCFTDWKKSSWRYWNETILPTSFSFCSPHPTLIKEQLQKAEWFCGGSKVLLHFPVPDEMISFVAEKLYNKIWFLNFRNQYSHFTNPHYSSNWSKIILKSYKMKIKLFCICYKNCVSCPEEGERPKLSDGHFQSQEAPQTIFRLCNLKLNQLVESVLPWFVF